MKKRCLTICPTRGRVEKCREMLESFLDTAFDSDIVFVVDKDDPCVEKYWGLFIDKYIQLYVLDRASTTEHINYMYELHPNYDFYHLINDDFVYRTNGWDQYFINVINDCGDGIAFGNDLYMKDRLPVAPFIPASIVKALGWLQLPTLTHLCGDMVWKFIGDGIKRLYYCKEVIIDHKHPFSKEHNVLPDETHLHTNSKEMYVEDNARFRAWVRDQSINDIEKVKNAIKLEM